MTFLQVNCLVEQIAWLVLFPQGSQACGTAGAQLTPKHAQGRAMKVLDEAPHVLLTGPTYMESTAVSGP